MKDLVISCYPSLVVGKVRIVVRINEDLPRWSQTSEAEGDAIQFMNDPCKAVCEVLTAALNAGRQTKP